MPKQERKGLEPDCCAGECLPAQGCTGSGGRPVPCASLRRGILQSAIGDHILAIDILVECDRRAAAAEN